jgi:hypothetical protein
MGKATTAFQGMTMSKIREREEDMAMQRAIRSRANYSLAVLGKSFVTNGSGRFFNIRTAGDLHLVKRGVQTKSNAQLGT